MRAVTELAERAPASALLAAVLPIRRKLAWLLEKPSGDADLTRPPIDNCQALAKVAGRFGLDDFETDLLLLSAGVEVDPELGMLLAATGAPLPTLQLAAALTAPPSGPGDHAGAIAAGAPLRRWQLIELGPSDTLISSPVRISERLLMHLVGSGEPDDRLAGVVRPCAIPEFSDVSIDSALTEMIVAAWGGDRGWPAASNRALVRLAGGAFAEPAAVLGRACDLLGLTLYEVDSSSLPTQPRELAAFARLWEREALLGDAALLVHLDPAEPPQSTALRQFLAHTAGWIALSGPAAPSVRGRDEVIVEFPEPGLAQRRAAWVGGLTAAGLAAGPAQARAVDEFVGRYRLSPREIRTACRQAGQAVAAGTAVDLDAAVRQACARRSRPRMDGLAEHLKTTARWDDLILPEPQTQALQGIVRRVRQHDRVLTEWGFAGFRGGAGVTALFAGPSGTGKTMAAGIVAGELGLELYRVDLGALIDKYVGETEKNLSRVFDAAGRSGAVLFFDEADALFGRRGEVRDSHDRYANIQISHLLQKMDSYEGLAILATNLSAAMDSAFLRRLTYVVRFPFPDLEQRRRIWCRAFPPQTPTSGLDHAKLAALQVSGAGIRNIALAGAFRAADTESPVGMAHLLAGAIEECAKQERPVLPAEVLGWV